jgi:hypothetical protein
MSQELSQPDVLRVADIVGDDLENLCNRYGMSLELLADNVAIPGSYWGESEAGLQGRVLFVRRDTPVHSALHEGCHYICMDIARRNGLNTDAGGDYDEENAVCYLQIVLADFLPGIDRNRMLSDMDRWGYTFRLGSARAWFEQDAEDALRWLQREQVLDELSQPTWRVRQ